MSNSDNTSVPAPDQWKINVTLSELMSSGQLPDIAENRGKEDPSIFRVPESIRKSDPSAYIPELVAIGPYHRHQKSLPDTDTDICKSLEQYKVWSVHTLLSGSSPAETKQRIDSCLAELKRLAPRIRRCYSADDIGLPHDGGLAELMLLDGCFILIGLLGTLPKERRPSCKGDLQGPLLGFGDVWYELLRDLLKIENQIPMLVLTTLLRETPWHGDDVIDLARKLFKDIGPQERKSFKPREKNDRGEYPYHHLLHFYYSSRLPDNNTSHGASKDGGNRSCCSDVAVSLNIPECLKVPRVLLNKSANDEDKKLVATKYLKIPSATDLDREGVGFKENKNPESFVDIKFTKGKIWGRDLEIPRMVMWNDTHHLLRNLVAFEQCCKKIKVKYVSDYVVFMDFLIDDSRDVGLLESGGILVNNMDVKKNVALLSSNLTKGVGFNEKDNYLRTLYGEVNDYGQSFWHLHRHVAKGMNDYFSSPWSCLSLVAAIVLLVMTCLQTVYALIDHYNT